MHYIYVNAEWPHNVNADKTWRRLQSDYHYEAGPMLSFSSDLELLAVCAVDSSLELPQGPLLGAVAPPDGKPEASH